jgi:hypothetical protein
LKFPPYHWWRTVFFLIPAISVYTIVLGAASIVSSLFDGRGYFAHGCARAWSWLILKTTGVRVEVEGLERVVAAVPAAHHLEGVAGVVPRPWLAPSARRPSVCRPSASRSRGHPRALARPGIRRAVAPDFRRRNPELGGPRRPFQGRQLSARD